MSVRSSRAHVVVAALVLALAALLWVARSREGVQSVESGISTTASRASAFPGAPSSEAAAAPESGGSVEVPVEADGTGLGEHPRTGEPSALAAPRPSSPVDPCAELEHPIERHDRLDELVNARLSELHDRGRLAIGDPSTSEQLRGALEAVLVHGGTDLAALEPALRAPDRVVDGFDLVAALALAVAVRLDRASSPTARAAIDRAMRLAPDDAVPYVLAAIRHAHVGDRAGFRDALGDAISRDRAEPAIAIELAHALARTVDSDRAIDATDAYLGVYPADPIGLRMRAGFEGGRDGVGPGAGRATQRGVTVLAPPDIARTELDLTMTTVATALDEAAQVLGVPRRNELALLVHRDHDAMLRAMCGQSWTAAAYDGVLHIDRSLFDDEQLRPADRAAVLRHETLHAALHDVPRDVPYWFDEGVAQHFARMHDPSLSQSYARLVRDRTWVPFASLDGAFLDIDDAEDARLAYHQSLAMIEWLVARRGQRGVAELLRRIESQPRGTVRDPAVILGEVAGAPFDGDVLLGFLAERAAGER